MTMNKNDNNQGPNLAVGAGIGAAVATGAAPAVVAGLGFTSQGIVGGSMAASIMAAEATAAGGGVAAGGLVATLQSVGVVGVGVGATVGVAILGASIGLALQWLIFTAISGSIAHEKKKKASNDAKLKEKNRKMNEPTLS